MTKVGASEVRAELPKFLAEIVTHALDLGWTVSRGSIDNLILHSSGRHPGNPVTISLPKDPRRMSSAKVNALRSDIEKYKTIAWDPDEPPPYDQDGEPRVPTADELVGVVEPLSEEAQALGEAMAESERAAAEARARVRPDDKPEPEPQVPDTPNRRRIAALEQILQIAYDVLGETSENERLRRELAVAQSERDQLLERFNALNKDIATAFARATGRIR